MTRDEAAKVQPAWGRRIRGIEGLRGLAALTVLVHHAGSNLAEGTLGGNAAGHGVTMLRHGLTLFFVLSGFLLYRQYVSEVVRGIPAPRVKPFLINRCLRIFPAYVVILTLTSYVFQVARPSAAGPSGRVEQAGPLSVVDYFVSLPLLQTLTPDFMRSGMQVAWSLTTEFTFYLVLPALAALGVRLARRGMAPVVAALVPAGILFAVGLTGRAVDLAATRGMDEGEQFLWRFGDSWTAVFSRSILSQGDLFAYGMAAAVVTVALQAKNRTWSRTHLVASVAAGALLLAALWRYAGSVAPFDDSAAGVLAALVLLAVVLPMPAGRENGLAGLLDLLPFRLAGEWSYSVYLWHYGVIWFVQRHGWAAGDTAAGFVANLALIVAITYALSALTYRFIEKPALDLKKRTARTPAGAQV